MSDFNYEPAVCIFCGFQSIRIDMESHLYCDHLKELMKPHLRHDVHWVRWAIEEGKKISSGLGSKFWTQKVTT